MIYNALQQRICIGKINTTDLFKVVPKPILHNVKGWWNRQQDRLDIRLYAFCKNVIDNGFVDPIILWYSDQKNEFAIHPGMNRIALNNVLNYNMKAWVISYDIKDYKRLGRVFPGITKLQLDEWGNRDIQLTAQHRTDNRLYEIVFKRDRILPTLRNPHNFAEWTEAQCMTGFHIWHKGQFIATVGNATDIDHWEVDNVSGIYELALKYFFNYGVENAFIHRKTT